MDFFKRIRNCSNRPLTIAVAEKQEDGSLEQDVIELGPYESASYLPDVADQFLKTYKSEVREDTMTPMLDFSYADLAASNGITWVYNTTGCPWAPEEVDLRKRGPKGEGWVRYTVLNPNKAPRDLKYNSPPIEGTYTGQSGKPAGYVGSRTPYTVEPYRRKALPNHVAKEMMARQNNLEGPWTGVLKKTHQPDPVQFPEPDNNWSFEDMLLYMKRLSPSKRQEFEPIAKGHQKILRGMTSNKSVDPKKKQAAEMTAKQDAMKWLFFLINDPEIQIPSREELENFLGHELPAPQFKAGDFQVRARGNDVTGLSQMQKTLNDIQSSGINIPSGPPTNPFE